MSNRVEESFGIDTVNTVYIFYQSDKSNIKMVQLGRCTAIKLINGNGYKLRYASNPAELNALDLSGKSYPVIIPGYRGKGKRFQAEAIRRFNKYKRDLAEHLVHRCMKTPARDEFIRQLLI